jgi:hypothetical protein
MAEPEKQEQYKRRLHSGEVIFAYIKQVLGVGQFLLRGLDNVKTEWLWVCTTYNLIKLTKYIGKLRGLSSPRKLLERCNNTEKVEFGPQKIARHAITSIGDGKRDHLTFPTPKCPRSRPKKPAALRDEKGGN